MTEPNDDKVGTYIVKPLLAAGITAVAMPQVGAKNILVMGNYVPTWVVTGAGALVAGYVGEMAHQYVLPHLSPNAKFAQAESAILSPAVAGMTQVALLEVLSKGSMSDGRMLKTFAVGAISDIAAQYAYEQTLVPLEQAF